MDGVLTAIYPWVKALHVIAVIAWMAGLLYLPRLFVYHCEAAPGPESQRFKTMERKLLKIIMNPAMIAVWVLGPLLAFLPPSGGWLQGWLIAKFALVAALTGAHHAFARWRKDFERDANTRPQRFYRIWNEVPAVLMAAIVVLAVVKPF